MNLLLTLLGCAGLPSALDSNDPHTDIPLLVTSSDISTFENCDVENIDRRNIKIENHECSHFALDEDESADLNIKNIKWSHSVSNELHIHSGMERDVSTLVRIDFELNGKSYYFNQDLFDRSGAVFTFTNYEGNIDEIYNVLRAELEL